MPTSPRPGFNIPNYLDLASGYGDQAEPDSGDFLVLGNHRNGVLTGCDFTFADGTFTIISSDNLVVVNGATSEVPLSASVSVSLTGGPRFYLVVWTGSSLVALDGGPAVGDNAVFPTLTGDVAVLAAVFVPETGSAAFVDKRLFLARNLHGWAEAPTTDFVSLESSTGKVVAVDTEGTMYWGDEGIASIGSAGNILNLTNNVTVQGGLEVGGTVRADAAELDGLLTSSNLQRGTGEPADGGPGDVYQRADGANSGLYFHTGSGWVQFMPPAPPTGTIITHIAAPASSAGADLLANGWLAFGTTVADANTDHPTLWSMAPAAWKSGSSLVLPNLSGHGLVGGTAGAITGDNEVSIQINNLPAHKHRTGTAPIETSLSGGHSHSGSSIDPVAGHRHDGVDQLPNGGGFVYTDYNGIYRIEPAASLPPTPLALNYGTLGSTGKTTLGGGHTPVLRVAADPGHRHTIPADSTVGSNVPLPIAPLSMGIHYYIKS